MTALPTISLSSFRNSVFFRITEKDFGTAMGPQRQADHLCVLVHGLWGNPTHFDFVATALRERHSEERLFILAAQQNAGFFTYDGIELGGERVAHEIEETLEKLTAGGYRIRKISVVGYSLGGLVARYAVGLLHARGWLDKLEPVNFTTFVAPHVGVRTPSKGVQNHLWNVLGARTVSMSGRQLFMIDSFRGTGKPLLSILADPDSIFMRALAKFKHRCLYANIINDRATVFYTAGISKVDPFINPEKTNFNYIQGYDPVVIDPDQPILPPAHCKDMSAASVWARRRFLKAIEQFPLIMFLFIFVPIASMLFLLNSVVQTFLSRQRIRLHEEGKTGAVFSCYKVPLMVQDVRDVVEDVLETINASQDQGYFTDSTSELVENEKHGHSLSICEEDFTEDERSALLGSVNPTRASDVEIVKSSSSYVPTDTLGEPMLGLTPAQFAMIDSLNSLGFRKYPVYIHNDRHTHAAIIVRMPKKGFEEGKIVLKHWLDNEFEV